jgi:hypothetical protein
MYKYKQQLFAYRLALEQTNINIGVFGAIKTSSRALEEVNQRVPINKIDEIMDQATEQLEVARETMNRLSEPIQPSGDEPADEEELERELAELTRTEQVDYVQHQLSRLPSPPQSVVEEEEDDMKSLRVSMATLEN